MSTRLLKVLTSLCIVAGLLLMVGWPVLVGAPPGKQSKREAKRQFVMRGLVVASGLTVVVLGAGIGAFVLMRRARDEYRDASLKNMRELLEGAREDHQRPKEEPKSADE